MLTVEEMLYGYKSHNTYCRCKCRCGNERIIAAYKLKPGSDFSCGCDDIERRRKRARPAEMAGGRYGRLTVVEEKFNDDSVNMVRCVCDCGSEGWYRRGDVLSGHTLSCGCLQKERACETRTKDFSGMVSDSGVRLLRPAYQKERGVWIWECECPYCGGSFYALPANVLSNKNISCGCYVLSNGEAFVKRCLDEFGVKYEQQKRFDDCKYKNKLAFDFAVYDSEDNIKALIEYDGAQHYKPVDFLGGESAYELSVIRDSIKNDYCKKNNIPLVRVTYAQSETEIKNTLLNILNP